MEDNCSELPFLALFFQALGNHEFDNGVEGLRPFLQSVSFPVLSSNIDANNEPMINGLFAPSVIKVIDGQKIGIVGYTIKETPELADPSKLFYLCNIFSGILFYSI